MKIMKRIKIMKRKMKTAAIIIAGLSILWNTVLFAASSNNTQTCKNVESTKTASEDKQELVDLVDSKVTKWIEDQEAVGAVASIATGDKILLSKGYGYADKEAEVLADEADTAFRIGSVSKTMVALAAVQLEEQGKLDMNADITPYLEADFPKFKYPITMQQLLTHTGGFENKDSGLFISENESTKPLSEVVRTYKPEQVFVPGEVASYSNYGLALAGYVVERISGSSFEEYAKEKIFAPLKMNNTTYSQDIKSGPTVSKGYGNDGKEREEGIVNLYPAGSVTTTAEDMGKYIQLLLNEKSTSIIQNDTKLKMFQQQFTMDKNFDGIGYTWGRCELNGHWIYAHEGGTDNFATLLFLYPDQDLGVFVSFNTQIDFSPLIQEMNDLLCGAEKTKQEVSANIDVTKDIHGTYIFTKSNFSTAEKVFNFLYTMKVTGNTSEGFYLDGKKLQSVDNDTYYNEDSGYWKVIEKNGRCYLTNSENFSYIRAHWYDGMMWQMGILILFILTSIVGFIVAIILFIRGALSKNRLDMVLTLPSILRFLIIVVSVIKSAIFFRDLHYASVEDYILFLRCIALNILLLGGTEIIATGYSWVKKKSMGINMIRTLSSFAFLVFFLWLVYSNLI